MAEEERFFPAKKRPIKAGGRLAEINKELKRTKSSSTSTLYINSTVSTPDVDELLHCTAMKIKHHIVQGQETIEKVYFDIFDERINPIFEETGDVSQVPSIETIYDFISTTFKAESLSAECAIMMLAYIERIISFTGITIDPSNWRRVILSTLILASKVWEDQAVWNVDFCSIFPRITVQDLANLEKVLLRLLQFNVTLQGGTYAKYYFELREYAERDAKSFPLEPLDKEGAKRLEQRSATEEEKAREQEKVEKFPRSRSSDQLVCRSPRVVLN